MNRALIVIDVQNEYVTGNLPIVYPDLTTSLANIGAAIDTANRQGKSRRTRYGTGKRKDTKRAIVTLREGTIDIFGGSVA